MESTSTHQRPAMHTAEAHMRSALLPNCSNFIRSMHFTRISNTRSSMASIFRCLLHASSASLLFVFRATAVNWAVLAAFRPRRRSCSPLPLWILPVVLDLTASMNSGLFPVAAASRRRRPTVERCWVDSTLPSAVATRVHQDFMTPQTARLERLKNPDGIAAPRRLMATPRRRVLAHM